MKRPARLAAVRIAASVSLCAAAAAQETSEGVVAKARHALGWDALVASGGAVRAEGSARILGTDAVHTLLFDSTGRVLERYDGPLRQENGSDGHVTWTRDWTDTPRALVLGDRATADVGTWLLTGGWTACAPDLSFELAESTEDERVLAFAHADGVLTGTIRLDAATYLPREARFGYDETHSTWSFAGFLEHEGFRFPSRVEVTQQGLTQSIDTRLVERVPRIEPETFQPRLDPPEDASFDADVAPEVEVERVATGHLLVHPTVGGDDLGWFIFDSGAGINCISTEVTEALAEGPFGEIGARGIGGTVPARFWRADDLRLGPITVRDPLFMELDLAFLEPHFGVPVGGIVGFEFLARCVVELDMSRATIAVHDPARYRLPEGGRWEDLVLCGRLPCVRAGFEDNEGVFKIDTGAAQDTVTFHYQVVRDLDLTAGRETSAGQAGGVGGNVGTRVGTLESFRLGGHDFTALPASFALEDKGAFSDDYVWGNIGGKLLEPFRLVFDYPNGRLGFVPR